MLNAIFWDVDMLDTNIFFCFPVFSSSLPHITKHSLVKPANKIGIQDFVCLDCLHPRGVTRNVFQLQCIEFSFGGDMCWNQSFDRFIFKSCGVACRFDHLNVLSHSLEGDSKISSTIFSKAALEWLLVNSCASRYIWCEIVFILSCAIQAAWFLTMLSRVVLGAKPYTNTQSSWSAIFSRIIMFDKKFQADLLILLITKFSNAGF